MKALWKVPASLAILAVSATLLVAMVPLCMILTLFWLPLAMGGALDSDNPPMFWPFEVVSCIFEWWASV